MVLVPACLTAKSPILARKGFLRIMRDRNIGDPNVLRTIPVNDVGETSGLLVLEELPADLLPIGESDVYLHVVLDVFAQLFSHEEQWRIMRENLGVLWINLALLAEVSFGPPWSKDDRTTNLEVLRSLMGHWSTFESLETRLTSTGFFLSGWREWGTRIGQLCSVCGMPSSELEEVLHACNRVALDRISKWLEDQR